MGIISDELLIQEGEKIVRLAERQGVILRLIGALAVRLHSEEFSGLHKKMDRLGNGGKYSFTDIDFVAYSNQRKNVLSLFEKKLKYEPDNYVMALFGKSRCIYYNPQEHYHVDIFFDKLEFSHDIFFGSKPGKGRLELDNPTITVSDLFLEKAQIHEINEKDIKDLIVLLRAHDIGEEDKQQIINAKYISNILADDWGFWYDAKLNLNKVNLFANQYHKKGLLSAEDLMDVKNKIDVLLKIIDEAPKTKKWVKRAKKGTNKCWWRKVEEVVR